MGSRARVRSGKRPAGVLVPLDGSKLAEAAIGAAEEVLGPAARRMLLLSVVAPVNPAPLLRSEAVPRRTLQARYEQAGSYLAGVRQRLARRRIRARVVVTAGDPAAEILACAEANRVPVIAMATHGRSGLGRALVGSVTEAVMRRATSPVLIVRPRRA
jgi:nucleotide-binding universal stress UspA family protein